MHKDLGGCWCDNKMVDYDKIISESLVVQNNNNGKGVIVYL